MIGHAGADADAGEERDVYREERLYGRRIAIVVITAGAACAGSLQLCTSSYQMLGRY